MHAVLMEKIESMGCKPFQYLMVGAAFASIGGASTAALAAADDDYINPDRPGIADGSTTVGPGHFQIETSF